jgi:hypothetical protein
MVSGVHFSSEVLDHSKVTRFQDSYRNLCVGKQPTSFCGDICPDKLCLYRFSLSEALRDNYFHNHFIKTINEGGDGMYEKLNAICMDIANEVILPGGNEEIIREIALCFALQKSYSIKSFRRKHIWTVMENLINLNRNESTLGDIDNDDYERGENG